MSPMVNIDLVDLDMDVVDMWTWCVIYREMIKHHTQYWWTWCAIYREMIKHHKQYCKEFHLRTDLILELLVCHDASVPSL